MPLATTLIFWNSWKLIAIAERSNEVLVVVIRRWKGIGWFLGHEGTPGTDSYFSVSIVSSTG
jgi:hypothetical protein